MKKCIAFFLLLSCFSCIPIRFAPNIRDYKIVLAKRFKKDLPKEYAFVFKDNKQADEFYNYINTKFNLNYEDVDLNVPLSVGMQTVFMSFYERDRISETGNLIPLLIDGILISQDQNPLLEDAYSSRNAHWYILITVTDQQFKDCLAPDYPSRLAVIAALKDLKDEYLSVQNYDELFFTKK
ncbi:hypothetical protein [Robiginitalea sp. IMCC43444]|uniref:hypothetical protein n=1 Tax=Robiginitalea sp. IMCC43444 TaxID=3459121 RepID=UPI0040434698